MLNHNKANGAEFNRNTIILLVLPWLLAFGGLIRLRYQVQQVVPRIMDVSPGMSLYDINTPVPPCEHPTIYVGMAAFRDVQCQRTLISTMKRAAHPECITVGVFQQNDPTDPDCFEFQKQCPDHFLCKYLPQFRIKRIHFMDAAGPTTGRTGAQSMLRDEEFYLQIDTHMSFVRNWDLVALNVWRRTQNEYAVLATYPQGILGMPDMNLVPVICGTRFLEKDAMYMAKHREMQYIPAHKGSYITPYWASGFSFSKAHQIRRVPYDAHTPYIFDGEEFCTMMRMWTHGYDVYAPEENIVFHLYADSQDVKPKPKFWEFDWQHRWRAAHSSGRRLWHILGYDLEKMGIAGPMNLTEADKYSLGNNRTVQEFEKWAHVDVYNHKAEQWCKSWPQEPWPSRMGTK